jgi:tRNA A37 N6-isopentenylltransferase MiaA
MKILVVSADKETVAKSLVESQKRLDDVMDAARSANEAMFEALLNIDPDDEEATPEDRIKRADEIETAEKKALKAWAKYDCALLRFAWERAQARKAGLVD